MALTKMTKDMAIIQALDDEPNDVGGLTAQELKEKFDEAGETIKKYLNETLTSELDTALAGTVPTTRTVNRHPLSADVIVTKSDVGLGNVENTSDADKPVSTQQKAALMLKANKTDVLEKENTTPSADYHPATKKYVDDTTSDIAIGILPDKSVTSEKLADGSVTAEKMANQFYANVTHTHLPSDLITAVPVSKGGTGKTTAAEALAALGGVSAASLAAYDKTIKGTYPIATGNSVTAGDVVDVVDGEVTRSVVAEANVENVFVSSAITANAICRLNASVSLASVNCNNRQIAYLLDNQTGRLISRADFTSPAANISIARLSDSVAVISKMTAGYIYATVVTISGTTFQSLNTVQAAISSYFATVAINELTVVVFYESDYRLSARVLTLVDGSLGGGSGYQIGITCSPQNISATLLPNDSSGNKRVCVCFSDANDNDKGKAVIVTINSSNVVTWGSVVTFNNAASHNISCASNGNTVVVSYNNNSACYCRVLAVNGTSITAGSQTQFEKTEISVVSFVVYISGKFVVLGYGYASGVGVSGSYAIVLNVSGLNITVNTAYQFSTSGASGLRACPISDNKLIATYIDNGNNNYGTSTILEVNGNQIAGGFTVNSTQAIALESGEAGQEIDVIFAGTTAADFVTEGQKIPSDGVYGYGPVAGWLNVIPYWAKEAGVKIVTGSYVGTGSYGQSNSNSLTFQVDPKLVIIRAQQRSYDSDNMAIFIKPVLSSTSISRMQKAAGQVLGATIPCTWDKNTLTWYSTANQDEQLNTGNSTYYYVAIG